MPLRTMCFLRMLSYTRYTMIYNSRLVVPTNFTKLGLWTLGQSSSDPKRNPIAGILQKELDITPQQGRKIDPACRAGTAPTQILGPPRNP